MSRLKYRWQLALVHVIVGVVWLAQNAQVLVAPATEPGLYSPAALSFAYVYLVIFLMYTACVMIVVRGKPVAQLAFLCLLSMMVLPILLENAEFIRYLITSRAEGGGGPLSLNNMWASTQGLRWVLWLAFNVWIVSKQ